MNNIRVLTLSFRLSKKFPIVTKSKGLYRKVVTKKESRESWLRRMNKTRQSRRQVSRVTSFHGEFSRAARREDKFAVARIRKQSFKESRRESASLINIYCSIKDSIKDSIKIVRTSMSYTPGRMHANNENAFALGT